MIAVIVNPYATGHGSPEHVSTVLRREGIEAEVVTLTRDVDITFLAKKLLAEGHSPIVAAGGDGTVRSVAAAVVTTGGVLGVLPLGGLNHFARDLGIPASLDAAARILKTGTVKAVDVAEVNGRMFVNNSGLGLYPQLVEQREKHRRLGSPKWIAFFRAAFATFRRFPFLNVRLIAEGQEFRRRTPFVFVGANVYHVDGIGLGSRGSLTGGTLFLGVARRTIGRWGLVWLAFRALLGHMHDARDVEFLVTREIEIASRRRRLHISLDGEVARIETPLHYRVRPGALQVIAP